MALIIDTDIGSDIDDCMALAYAVRSGMDVKLVTTVHGDVIRRAKIAHKLLDLLGADIPVAAGSAHPIKQKQIFTIGTEEHYAIDKHEVDSDGVVRLADCIRANPGIDIAAIGPMTNIAKAFSADTSLAAKVGHIYAMGNAIITPDNYHINYRSHNFKVDPEAVDVVFSSGVPITIVTTEVCKRNSISREQLERFTDPALQYIACNGKRWLTHINYPCAFLYDPLAVHHHKDTSITTKRQYGNVSITTDVDCSFSKTCLETLLGGS